MTAFDSASYKTKTAGRISPSSFVLRHFQRGKEVASGDSLKILLEPDDLVVRFAMNALAGHARPSFTYSKWHPCLLNLMTPF
jgi:hypothetical protein